MAASTRIRDVWTVNLEAEMRNIRDTIEQYPCVALDTEFPGVVARPIGPFKTQTDYHYQTMRCNVDLLKIIQIGLTFSDEDGNTPPETSTWQFNFHFSVKEDIYRPESIELLQKAGIDFERHEEMGISPSDFAELMITSGLVLAPETKWISFHSPYDFGYFVRLLTAMSLPTSEDDFFELLRIWFPSLFDIKVMMRVLKEWRGGLQDLADELGVARIGTSHQAGSDSLLTSSTFFKVRETYFHDGNENEYNGILYGIGSSWASLGVGAPADSGRSGVTLAEREDRSSTRELMGQTSVTTTTTQSAAVPIMPAIPNSPYGALNGPYLRTTMVGGGR